MSSNYPGPYDQYANTSWDKAQQPRGLDTPVQEILKFQQRQLQHNPGRNAYLPQGQQVNYSTPGIPATPDATQLLQQAKIILAQTNPQLANSANSTNANNQAFRLLQQLTQPQPQQAAYSAASVGVANRAVFGQQAPLHQYDQRALSADYLSGRQASTQASLYGQAPGQTQARALQYGSGYDDPRNLSAQLSNYPSLSTQSNQGSLFGSAPSQSASRQQASSNTSSGFSSSGSGSRNSNSNSSSRNSNSNSNSSASNRDRQRNNNNNNSGFRGGRNDDNGNSGGNNRRNDRRDDPPPRRDDRNDRRDDPPPRREPDRAKSPKKETRKRKASPPPNNTSNSKSKPLARSIDTIQKTEFHHSFAVKQIDYLQLKQRHRKLHIPKDFSHVECLCADLNNEVPTSNFYLDIECSTKKDESSKIDQILKVDSETASIASDGVVYTSKVMLFAGFKQPYGKSNSHLSNQLKFIVGKKDRSELFCIGGAWSYERDGGDPSVDRSVLKATAIHYFKEFTGLDLSVCKEWIHFMDIHYQRPTGTEVSVIWIPCIWQSPLLNNIVSNLASSKDLSASTSSPQAISAESESALEPSSPTPSATPTADPSADSLADPPSDPSSGPPSDPSSDPPSDPSSDSSAIPSAAPSAIDAMETSPSPSTVEAPLSSPVDSIEKGEIVTFHEVTEQATAPEASEGLSPSLSSNTGGSNTSSESSTQETPTSTSTTTTNNTETAADSTNNNNSSQSSDTTPTNNPTNIPKESTLRDSSSSSRTRFNLVTNVPSNVKLKPMSLSLHGLLEYDENDVFEKTFEVSLFGELFNDMLKREFGATILNALDLYSKRRSNAISSNEPPTKKQKLDEADTINSSSEVASEEKPLLSTTEDIALLRAMDFFDKHGHGYLRPDEMETILYCLGKSLCKRVVEELVDKVIDPDSGRILYKKMIEDRTLFGHEL